LCRRERLIQLAAEHCRGVIFHRTCDTSGTRPLAQQSLIANLSSRSRNRGLLPLECPERAPSLRLGLGLLVPGSPDDRGHAAFVLRHPAGWVRRNPLRRAWALSEPLFGACNCFMNTQRWVFTETAASRLSLAQGKSEGKGFVAARSRITNRRL